MNLWTTAQEIWLSDFVFWSEFILRTTDNAEGNDNYATELAKNSYEKIITETNVANLKNYLTAGHYAMSTPKAGGESQIFEKNFKLAVKLMFTAEKENLLESYGLILKYLLNVYRKFDEVVAQVAGNSSSI